MKTNMHFLSYLAHFLEWETFQPKFGGNQITHFMLNPCFFSKIVPFEIKWNDIVQPDRPHDNIAHVHCTLDS
jgi:hypothetical protein